ncbi:MAG TPA: PVC-type heme-binding CxxCH protein [Saprospiraceae bacterium]|nr:PVC-type heme-binding CxxCH protein [Saprospiraceae bacterium]
MPGMKNPSIILILLTLVSCGMPSGEIQDNEPRKIEVLFLGHASEHHNSGAYMPIIAAALATEGINFTYTEDPQVLAQADELQPYDALLLYANHDSITPPQEKGLFDFVESGKGFLPIHSASFCFRNSDDFVELVGAQFKEHGTGVFTTEIVNREHSITDGLDTFATWDETYVHHLHNEDKEVLMVREDEPWTWVRTQGQGRIFYTAYGHDERTWTQPGFQELVKRAILWSVGDRVRGLWESYRADMPGLAYDSEAGPIPNYEKRDPAPQMQLPLSAEESHKLTQVPPGFDLQLFASEPDIINPIAMDWDEKGRLWVVETVDYPNTVRNNRMQGDDRIKICEDTDGDGRADKFTIFAEELNIPTSMTFVNGGVLISQAPYFIFLKDEDGDDKADIKEIAMEGWGTFDTHAGPSNLQYGIDNRIWGVVGYSGFEGKIAGDDYRFRQGIYHFSRDYDDFQFLARTSNNTWGLGFTNEHDVFASTANNTHSVFMAIPDDYFDGVKGIPNNGSVKIDGHYDMLPITPNYRQVDVFGGFTAAAGHHFYTADNYPKKYHNQIAFVCEPTGGLVHQAIIQKKGSGFAEIDGGNLLASADEWVSPVEAKVGPDGQVWVADWYNFIVQHNPTPRPDFGGFEGENGDGNAHVNPLRDKQHGRIWRVVYKGAPAGDIKSLDKDNPDELISALSSDNRFWRMTAQRLLVERDQKDVQNELIKLARGKAAIPALHALWTLEGLGLTDEASNLSLVEASLDHSSWAIRKAALQILRKQDQLDAERLVAQLETERSPEVQLLLFQAIADLPRNAALGTQLYDLSKRDAIRKDPHLGKAIYLAASQHTNGFMAAFLGENPNFMEQQAQQIPLESPTLDDSNWESMQLPTMIEAAGLEMDGIIWFRTTLELSGAAAARGIELHLGPIDDSDITYVNGQKVGETLDQYNEARVYRVPPAILQEGTNQLAIQLEDTRGGGGFSAAKADFFYRSSGQKTPLPQAWKYKVTKITRAAGQQLFQEESIAEVFAKAYLEDFDPSSLPEGPTADQIVELGVIKNEMKYDLENFTVTAGQTVSIVFNNDDFMQHNLLIGEIGSLEIIGAAADKLAADPNGATQNYIPNIDQVLYSTKLLDPNSSTTLTFQVPDEPGDYPFVCTFPGHWRLMNGVMKVVKPSL